MSNLADLFPDAEFAGCRWSEFIKIDPDMTYELLKDESVADYQGEVKIIYTKANKYIKYYCFLEYSYGSCGGCDAWEDGFTDEEVAEEIDRLTLELTLPELKEYLKRLSSVVPKEVDLCRSLKGETLDE